MNNPRISVIVVFYNMSREAERTLYAFSARHQQGVGEDEYEIIALDNGSGEPLGREWAESFGKNIRYVYLHSAHPSPCININHAAFSLARGEYLGVFIDGARIPSPSTLHYARQMFTLYPRAFVYTGNMMLGHTPQKTLAKQGYTTQEEDALIATVDWKRDGYALFSVSTLHVLPRAIGLHGDIKESNGFFLSRRDYAEMGGLEERFILPGGGMANVDMFRRAFERSGMQKIRLAGEATFHQFHGGVTSNNPRYAFDLHDAFIEEYRSIRGVDYTEPDVSGALLFGHVPPQARRFLHVPHGGR